MTILFFYPKIRFNRRLVKMDIKTSGQEITCTKGADCMKTQDTYQEPIVIKSETAIVRVYRPILTEEERARRMKQVHDAAAALLKCYKK